MPRGKFIQPGTTLRLGSRVNWLYFSGQRSLWAHVHPLLVNVMPQKRPVEISLHLARTSARTQECTDYNLVITGQSHCDLTKHLFLIKWDKQLTSSACLPWNCTDCIDLTLTLLFRWKCVSTHLVQLKASLQHPYLKCCLLSWLWLCVIWLILISLSEPSDRHGCKRADQMTEAYNCKAVILVYEMY